MPTRPSERDPSNVPSRCDHDRPSTALPRPSARFEPTVKLNVLMSLSPLPVVWKV